MVVPMRAVIAAALVLAAVAPRPGDAPLAPEAVPALERVAQELAKAGRAEELDELLEILRHAGMAPDAHEKRAKQCRADLGKAKKAAASAPSAARALAKAASDLAKTLPARAEPERAQLAELILRLDGSVAAAHEALGRELVAGRWLDARERARLARRDAILAAVAAARRLEVEVQVAPGEHRFFASGSAPPAFVARVGRFRLISPWQPEKLARVMRETVRGLALTNFLLTGALAAPDLPPETYVVFDSRADYLNALEIALERGVVPESEREWKSQLQWTYFGTECVGYRVFESGVQSLLLSHPVYKVDWKGPDPQAARRIKLRETQQSVAAGLLNWVSLAMWGTRLPVYVVEKDVESAESMARTASLSAEQKVTREKLRRLEDAGLEGGRVWMRYLAERREDPPYLASFQDDMGEIQGLDLLKATLVAEMLAEDGPLSTLVLALPGKESPVAPQELFEKAVGQPMSAFETQWREWLLGRRPGLVERLGGGGNGGGEARETLSPDERATLSRLREIRAAAGVAEIDVELDRDASDACRLHARYLRAHPDQAGKFPDMHEQYPDRTGFDPRGARAGTRAVIASGVEGGADALDAWMATYYHRLPLLAPGLVRIGHAFEDGIAVLDCGSFVQPPPWADSDRAPSPPPRDVGFWAVVWPPPGARDVPRRFAAEVPEPVPGRDCTEFGYPVTLMLRERWDGRVDVALELRERSATGEVVPAWLSTPTAPTNPMLATDDAWCLIPQRTLRAGGDYFVTGTIEIGGERLIQVPIEWSFRCGR